MRDKPARDDSLVVSRFLPPDLQHLIDTGGVGWRPALLRRTPERIINGYRRGPVHAVTADALIDRIDRTHHSPGFPAIV